jgi:hypothetical protein
MIFPAAQISPSSLSDFWQRLILLEGVSLQWVAHFDPAAAGLKLLCDAEQHC